MGVRVTVLNATAAGYVCAGCGQLLRLAYFAGAYPTIRELSESHACEQVSVSQENPVTPERKRVGSKADVELVPFGSPGRTRSGRKVGVAWQRGTSVGAQKAQCQGTTGSGARCRKGVLTEEQADGWIDYQRAKLLPYIGKICWQHAEKACGIT